MALKIGPCVRCGKTALQMTLKEGEGWVCSEHLPQRPNVHVQCHTCGGAGYIEADLRTPF